MNELSQLQPYIPLLVPILIIQLVLIVAALLDLAKRPMTRGPRWMWVLIILLFQMLGPIAYFVIGREEQ